MPHFLTTSPSHSLIPSLTHFFAHSLFRPQVRDSWRVTRDMADVPAWAIAGALIPAVVITVLFWFDHGVSAQLAQQKVGWVGMILGSHGLDDGHLWRSVV